MIDYDKLKSAHELANSYGKIKDSYVALTTYAYYKNRNYLDDAIKFKLSIDNFDIVFDSIDDLVAKLTELTQPESIKPKYEIGQDVWVINSGNMTVSFTITDIAYESNGIVYCLNDSWCEEVQIYPTREALIESQIEYWNKLRYPTIAQSVNNAQENIKELGEKLFPQQCPLCGQFCDNLFPIPKGDIEPLKEQCKHESDGNAHVFKDGDTNWKIVMSKCIKCGEVDK